MNLKITIGLSLLLFSVSTIVTFKITNADAVVIADPTPAPSLAQLNSTITKAQHYYQGLYTEVDGGAVIAEYYPKIKYTVRHATIGGIYYYNYIGDSTRSAKLQQLVNEYGFEYDYDHHSYIWKNYTKAPENIVYDPRVYHDCYVKLPRFKEITPYRSKVCSLGSFGVQMYILTAKLDPFLPMVNTLFQMQSGTSITDADIENYVKRFNTLGFGVPVCTPLGCSSVASTIRTAHFGEIALRMNELQYADTIASTMIKAQHANGAIYSSYDRNGKNKVEKSIFYKALDFFLNDKEAYKGVILTNAETMNDALAFLLHYRCQKYNSGCRHAESEVATTH